MIQQSDIAVKVLTKLLVPYPDSCITHSATYTPVIHVFQAPGSGSGPTATNLNLASLRSIDSLYLGNRPASSVVFERGHSEVFAGFSR
jgi:hypothetical protein